MRYSALSICLAFGLLTGCGIMEDSGQKQSQVNLSSAYPGGANAFNPYMREKLPNTRQLSAEGEKMLSALSAKTQSIEGEAAYRKNWRGEIYPVVYGDRNAPHEMLVILDFANPKSEDLWKNVVAASKSLSPNQCKIAVFGNSRENYGTDLMGLAIWLADSRKGQAMPWLTYALTRWNEVKAAQKSQGAVKKFTNEYDATASASDYPIHYGYLSSLKPPVPASQELAVARYCYNAGNVNMYQASQICQYYGVDKLPAVIVNGKVLSDPSADAILDALK